MQSSHHNNKSDDKMDQESVFRYSRQLIMPEIGVRGQQALKNASALVIGAGGLGCPVIQYLVAAGTGRIGIVDYDEVEMSNLHRQILHTEDSVKMNLQKATSAAMAATKLNSQVKIDEYHLQLDRKNALEIVSKYDMVIDATDNVPSRYLISDMCVIADKPLISGSALRWEGQLTVYHYRPAGESEHGPCYRCLYPSPPLPETVTNCSDGGVLGVVPGIIGCMQALEAIKIIIGEPPSFHKQLLVFDGLSASFRKIKLRGQQPSCVACGKNASITADNIPDYEEFCGMAATDKCRTINILPAERRISPGQYKNIYIEKKKPHVLLDVRQAVEIDICSLPNTTNVPIKALEYCKATASKSKHAKKLISSDSNLQQLHSAVKEVREQLAEKDEPVPVIVICKQGNDSQTAVDILNRFVEFENLVDIRDVRGGIMSWAVNVDPSVLRY